MVVLHEEKLFTAYVNARRPHVFHRGDGIEDHSDLFARETKPMIREIKTLDELRTNLQITPANSTTPVYIPTKQVMLEFLENKGGSPSLWTQFYDTGDFRSKLVGAFRLWKLCMKMRQLLHTMSREVGQTREHRARCVEQLANLSGIIQMIPADADEVEMKFFVRLESPFREDLLCQDLRAVASAWRAYETEGPRVCMS